MTGHSSFTASLIWPRTRSRTCVSVSPGNALARITTARRALASRFTAPCARSASLQTCAARNPTSNAKMTDGKHARRNRLQGASAFLHRERRHDHVDRRGHHVNGPQDDDGHPENWQVEDPVAHAAGILQRPSMPATLLGARCTRDVIRCGLHLPNALPCLHRGQTISMGRASYGCAMRIDLVHLVRVLRRSPASAAAAILTLAVTLGAGASIFAVVDAVLLTPPPFADPDALVTIGETPLDEPTGASRAIASATLDAWRDRARSLASIEAFDPTNLTLTGFGAAERMRATDVTPGFFALLGTAPMMGRGFSADDVGRPVAIVSHDFWRRTLDADPGVIARALLLDGQAHTIAGVMPERFFFALDVSDIWRPIPLTPAQAAGLRVRALARLAP